DHIDHHVNHTNYYDNDDHHIHDQDDDHDHHADNYHDYHDDANDDHHHVHSHDIDRYWVRLHRQGRHQCPYLSEYADRHNHGNDRTGSGSRDAGPAADHERVQDRSLRRSGPGLGGRDGQRELHRRNAVLGVGKRTLRRGCIVVSDRHHHGHRRLGPVHVRRRIGAHVNDHCDVLDRDGHLDRTGHDPDDYQDRYEHPERDRISDDRDNYEHSERDRISDDRDNYEHSERDRISDDRDRDKRLDLHLDLASKHRHPHQHPDADQLFHTRMGLRSDGCPSDCWASDRLRGQKSAGQTELKKGLLSENSNSSPRNSQFQAP